MEILLVAHFAYLNNCFIIKHDNIKSQDANLLLTIYCLQLLYRQLGMKTLLF